MMLRRSFLSFLLFIGTSGLVLEADLAVAEPEAQTSAVEQRARAYLDAIKIQDLQTAYLMHSGAHDKTLTAAEFYQRMTRSKSILLDFVIKKVTVEEDKAKVEFEASYQYPQLYEPMTMPRTQQWIFVHGDWYLQDAAPRDSSQPAKPGL